MAKPRSLLTGVGGTAQSARDSIGAADASNPLGSLPSPTIGTGTGQANFQGGALFHRRKHSFSVNGATCTGAVTDYLIDITDTSGAVTYQAVAMGSTATKAAGVIVRDKSYASAYGVALAHVITIKPVSGKKLNNVVDGTWTITTGGGSATVFEDESGNLDVMGGA